MANYNPTSPTIITDWQAEVSRGSTLTFRYPGNKDLTDDTWAVFRFFKYDYKMRKSYFDPHSKEEKLYCTIRLPLPSNMKHGYNTNITTSEFGPIADAIAQTVGTSNFQKMMSMDGGQAGSGLQGAWKNLSGGGSKIGEAMLVTGVRNILTSVSSALSGTDVEGLISAAAGQAVNNNLGAVFKGVDLRSFEFNYSFFPESRREAIEVKNIINAFRFFMSPGYADPHKMVFEYPHLVACTFEQGHNNDVVELQAYRVNPSFITSFNIDYSGQSNSSSFHFEDGQPTSTSFSFSLREVGIVDRDILKHEMTQMNDVSVEAYEERLKARRFAESDRIVQDNLNQYDTLYGGN